MGYQTAPILSKMHGAGMPLLLLANIAKTFGETQSLATSCKYLGMKPCHKEAFQVLPQIAYYPKPLQIVVYLALGLLISCKRGC